MRIVSGKLGVGGLCRLCECLQVEKAIHSSVRRTPFQAFPGILRSVFKKICIYGLSFSFRDFSTAFFNSIPISGSLSGSMMSSQSNQQLISLDSNAANSLNTSKPSVEPTAAASIKPTDDAANKDGLVFAVLFLTFMTLFT